LLVTEEELSEVKLVMKESLHLHRDAQTATAVSRRYMAHEKSHYKSSELVLEGIIHVSSISVVVLGFVV